MYLQGLVYFTMFLKIIVSMGVILTHEMPHFSEINLGMTCYQMCG